MLKGAYAATFWVVAVAGVGIACGSLDNGSSPGFQNNDSGFEDSTAIEAGGSTDGPFTTDSEVGSGDSAPPPETGALFVHASPDVPDLRLCWYVSSDGGAPTYSNTAPPFPSGTPAPESNYPALPIGGAVALPNATAPQLLGGDLHVTGIPAALLSDLEHGLSSPSVGTCEYWLGNGAANLMGQVTLYNFTIPAGPVQSGYDNIVALTGCAPNDPNLQGASAQETLAKCGPGYTYSAGNLALAVVAVNTTAVATATQLPVQAAQLSPALAQLAGDAGILVSFGPQGGAAQLVTLGAVGSLAPAMPTPVDAGPNAMDYGTLGFGVDVLGTDAGPGHMWMSLEQALALQSPTMNPAVYYMQETSYMVTVVGDPNAGHAFAPDASYDGTGLHVLVLPLP